MRLPLSRPNSEVMTVHSTPASFRCGHGSEQGNGIMLAAQPVEHGELAMPENIANRSGDALAHAWKFLQAGESFLSEDFGHRLCQSA
jgi:hypothetical protein